MKKINNLKKTIKITGPLEIAGFLRTNGTQCQFVSMLTETEVKVKKSCAHRDVKKLSTRLGLINMDYNTAVRKRIAAEIGVPIAAVEYENGAVWFSHVMQDEKKLPLVFHSTKQDNELYLQYFPLKSGKTKYVLPNGETIEKSEIEPHLYAKSKSEYKPATCVFKLSNIKQLCAAGFVIQTNETESVKEILAQ